MKDDSGRFRLEINGSPVAVFTDISEATFDPKAPDFVPGKSLPPTSIEIMGMTGPMDDSLLAFWKETMDDMGPARPTRVLDFIRALGEGGATGAEEAERIFVEKCHRWGWQPENAVITRYERKEPYDGASDCSIEVSQMVLVDPVFEEKEET